MARQSLDSFRRTVTVAWPAHQERAAKAHLVRVARAGHADIMGQARSRSGAEPSYEAYANRPGNSNLDNVVLPGPIVFRYRYINEIVTAALDKLRKASPVQSGDYVRSHTLYVNGRPVTADKLPAGSSLKDEIMIANPIAYARRLEIGVTKSGRPFVVDVAPRIYERVAGELSAMFGRVAKITFDNSPGVRLPDAGRVGGKVGGRTGISSHHQSGGRRVRRRLHGGESIRSPAIFIEQLT